MNQRLIDRRFLKARLQQLVVEHREFFEHLVASGLGLGLHRLGDRLASQHFTILAVEIGRLHRDQVDHSLEVGRDADRQLHQHRLDTQPGPHVLASSDRIGTGAIELVDEDQPRHAVTLDLAIDGQRLTLYATDSAQNQHRSIKHPQAPLHLDREIHVAGSVDEVDLVIEPFDAGGGTGDRDATFLFDIHVVHRGATAAVNLLHPVQSPGVEQDPFAERGLARIDVGRNANVPQPAETHRVTLVSVDWFLSTGFCRLGVWAVCRK